MGGRAGPEAVGVLLQVGNAAFLAVLGQLGRDSFARGVLMELLQAAAFVLGVLVQERLVGAGQPDRPGFGRAPHVPRPGSERSRFFFHKYP